MSRMSWPCLALCVLLLSGCSYLGIQDKGGAQQSGMSTPAKKTQQQAASDALAAKRAAAQKAAAAAQTQGQPQQPVQPVPLTNRSTKVALLAPLSGKSAALGQSMVNAAQLAVFDVGVGQFELMPRDTKGTPDGAVQAARDAIASGAQLLIGPLFAADVAAVKPVIRESSTVSMLALSTDVSLAESGVFVMGFAPAPQVDRVVAYASKKGLKRFAAVIPAGPYGQLVSKAFDKAVREHGGTIIVTESNGALAGISAQKDTIEAIFLPFGGADLRKIATQLSTMGVDKGRVRLLGTGLWDEVDLAQGEPFLIGGWFAAAEPDARERFMKNYQENYSQPAPRLSTLAYDATALAAVLARNGSLFDRAALCMPSGFAGLDGIFRLTQGGQIERGLAVLEVTGGSPSIVDPSPPSFTGR